MVICAWCKKDMGQKPPLEKEVVTHGICSECKAKVLAERPVEKGEAK